MVTGHPSRTLHDFGVEFGKCDTTDLLDWSIPSMSFLQLQIKITPTSTYSRSPDEIFTSPRYHLHTAKYINTLGERLTTSFEFRYGLLVMANTAFRCRLGQGQARQGGIAAKRRLVLHSPSLQTVLLLADRADRVIFRPEKWSERDNSNVALHKKKVLGVFPRTAQLCSRLRLGVRLSIMSDPELFDVHRLVI